MEPSQSPISSLSTTEATQLLKDLLNVGKARPNASDTSSNGLPSASDDQSGKSASVTSEHVSENGHVSVERSISASSTNGGAFNLQGLIQSMTGVGQSIPHQQITLQGDDSANSFCVYGREVDLIVSEASGLNKKTPGSNKVKINPVVNFDWEHKYNWGQLVAVHRNGIHMAYVLKGKNGGIVRLINRKTAERALLKGFEGRVLDVSFAHLSAVIIGAVDEVGNMFIHEITEDEGKILSELLCVKRPPGFAALEHHRLIWCPFIPEEDDSCATVNTTADSGLVNVTADSNSSDEVAKLLVLTHGAVAEIWNVDTVTKEYGHGPLLPDQVHTGFLTIKDAHTQPITDASFSPDGTAIATASLDGEVKFFQVYLQDKAPPRCLHQWKPHDGKPVTSLFFLDDHKHPNPESQFWKFAVTGANQNQEMKIWSCVSWTCLQTINFRSPTDLPSNFQVDPCLKATIDLSANYLIMSDIKRKVVYMMQVYQDADNGWAHVSSISEFLLTQPCLSFAILDASRRKFKKLADKELAHMDDVTTGEIEVEEEEVPSNVEGPDIGVVVKMYSVHTKALQELQIRFKPDSSTPQPPPASISSVSIDGLRDPLTDVSMETSLSDAEVMATERSNTSTHSHHSHISHSHELLGSPRSDRSHTSQHSDRLASASPRSDRSRHSTPLQSDRSSYLINDVGHDISTHTEQSIHGSLINKSGGSIASPRSLPSEPSLTSSHLPHQVLPTNASYQSDQSHESVDSKPVLMTPDAFTTSPRKAESSERQESILSNASSIASSLTHVSEMEGDNLRTPLHGSVVQSQQSQPSPASSITLTPSSSRDISSIGLGETPSSVPLPPPTPSEEATVGTPKRALVTSSPLYSASVPVTSSQLSTSPHVSAANTSANTSTEEFFKNQRRSTLESTESSSSTSLEVSEILEAARQPDGDEETEDENVVASHADEEEEEEEEEEEIDSQSGQLIDLAEQPVAQQSPYKSSIWPQPPNLAEVSMEAKRLAANAIQIAAELHSHHREPDRHGDGKEEAAEDDVDDDNSGIIPEQGDDDVKIEDEKEEEIEEEEEEGDRDLPTCPIATSSVASDGEYSDSHTSEHFYRKPGGYTGSTLNSHDRNVDGGAAAPSTADIAMVKELQTSLGQMLGLLSEQQREIATLRSEISQQSQTAEAVGTLKSQLDYLETILETKVAGVLSQHSQTESQRLHQVLTAQETQEQQKHDRLISTVTQTLDRTISARLDKTIRDEMKRTLLPSISHIIDPMKEQLHLEVMQKLTATDALVKDSINKMFRSRQMVDTIGTSVSNTMHGHMQAMCREMIVPGFDRACHNIFQQVSETFQKGSVDYVQQLERHMEGVRQRHEQGRDPVVGQLNAILETTRRREEAREPVYASVQSAADSLRMSTQQLQSFNNSIDTKITDAVTGLEDRLLTHIREMISEEVQSAVREQQHTISDTLISAMRSGAVTPIVTAVTPDPQKQQAEILQLLRQGELNAAFQQALTAVDLNLVIFVCETVNTSQVFGQTPCPLEQPVLLSLIQQLSADLQNKTELKNDYLQEAVMNLDPQNPVTREHMVAILNSLCQKLVSHIQAHPQDPMTKNLKMLLMMTRSLLK